jgi:hypothetical protein
MSARLPTVGGDSGNWGTVLNEYLGVEHGTDGTHSKPLTGQLVMKARMITSGASYAINATTDQIVIVNKSIGSATALSLPASPVTGMVYRIKDGKGDAASHNITITAPSSGTIDGQSSLVINANYAAVDLVYNGTEWNIV